MLTKKIAKYVFAIVFCVGVLTNSQLNVDALYNYSLSEVKYKTDKSHENGIEILNCMIENERKLESPIGEYNIFGDYIFGSKKYDITKIGKDFSFVGKEEVTKVIRKYYIIPRAVYRYDKYVYADIRSINLPKCHTIEDNALKCVKNLVTVNLPVCENIGENCFLNCINLESIKTSDKYVDVLGATFENCSKLEDFNNLSNVQRIDDRAFKGTNFKNISLDNCKEIGAYAFNNCQNLESIVLNDNYKKIKEGTFSGCIKLNDIKNTNGIEIVEKRAFKDCTSLETLNLSKCKVIERSAFEHCDLLKKITVPKDCIVNKDTLHILHKDGINSHEIEVEYVERNETFYEHMTEIEELIKQVTLEIKEEEKQFIEEDKETGIIFLADIGVIPSNSSIVVSKLTPENLTNKENFNQAIENLDSDIVDNIENLDLYSINLLNENGMKVQPVGEVTVMIPIRRHFDISDLELLRITAGDDEFCNSEIVEQNGIMYCVFKVNHFSIYCLCDKMTKADYVDVFAPFVILLISLSIIVVIVVRNKNR